MKTPLKFAGQDAFIYMQPLLMASATGSVLDVHSFDDLVAALNLLKSFFLST